MGKTSRRRLSMLLSLGMLLGTLSNAPAAGASEAAGVAAAGDSIAVNLQSVRQTMEGMGGNFANGRFTGTAYVNDNAGQFNVEQLNTKFARIGVPLRAWAPNSFEAGTVPWTSDADVSNPEVKNIFLLMKEMNDRSIPIMLSVWDAPNWMVTNPESGSNRLIAEDKHDEFVESIIAWLERAKTQYGVVPKYLSFNESEGGIHLAITAEQQIAYIKAIAPRLRALGIDTLFTLGDVGSINDHALEYIQDIYADPDIHPYLGPISYHPYWINGSAPFERLADYAQTIGKDLIATELLEDANLPNEAKPTWGHAEGLARLYYWTLGPGRASVTATWQYQNNVLVDNSTTPVVPHPAWYIMKQMADQLTPGTVLVESNTTNAEELLPIAAKHVGEDRFYLQVQNVSSVDRTVAITGLPNIPLTLTRTSQSGEKARVVGTYLPKNGELTITLQGDSFNSFAGKLSQVMNTEDTIPPAVPTNLRLTGKTFTTLDIAWNSSTDNVGLGGYDLYKDGQLLIQLPSHATSYTVHGLVAATNYTFILQARDYSGNLSAGTEPAVFRTEGDVTAPTAPTGLTTAEVLSRSMIVSWQPSTDTESGIKRYSLFNNGTELIASTTGTSVFLDNLTPSTTYTLTVRAEDNATNVSNASNMVTVKTLAQNKRVLYIGNQKYPASSTDKGIQQRIAELGYEIIQMTPGDISQTGTQAIGKDLVIVSDSISSAQINTKLKSVPVPVMMMEPGALDDMGMSPANLVGTTQTNRIVIQDATHPLAVGLTGTVTIAGAGVYVGSGGYGANANVIATMEGTTERAGIFYYNAGDVLFDGTTAPGLRIGFFLSNGTAETANPYTWALFKGAVQFAMGVPVDPFEEVTQPANLRLTDLSDTSVSMAWDAPTAANRGYNVYRNGSLVTPQPVAATTFKDNGLQRNTEYTYVVTAVYPNKESKPTNSLTVRTYASPSYFANPGFELGNTGWVGWGARTIFASSDAYSGTNVGRLGTGNGAFEQRITGLKPNTTYAVAVWSKLSEESVKAFVGVKDYGGMEQSTAVPSTAYTQVKQTFTTGATNTSAYVYIYKETKTGYVYADDIQLIEVDTAAPAVSATVTPEANSAGWHRGDVSVSVTAFDADSGVARIVLSATGAGAFDEMQVEGEQAAINMNAEGITEISYTAVDREGNVAEPQKLTVRLDKTGPTVSVAGARQYTAAETVSLSYVASDMVSGLADPDAAEGILAAGDAYALGLGEHDFALVVTDAAGNTTTETASISVIATYESTAELVERFVTSYGAPGADGIIRSLNAKLEQSKSAADRGNAGAASNLVNAFANQLEALKGKKLSNSDADLLIELSADLVK